MKKIVAKFGGSSLADANQIEKVKNIILSSNDRKYIVVSAAGKREKNDDKITDLLIEYHNSKENMDNQKKIKEKIYKRYLEMVKDLNIDYDVRSELDIIFDEEIRQERVDYIASRGEYISAKILSIYLNATFLDMQNVIIFSDERKVDYDKTFRSVKEKINIIEANACESEYLGEEKKDLKIVIPGFYGSNESGEVVTFSRGGSDITGSIVARAIGADVYENWTDVSGVMFADPRIAVNARPIDYITYGELRELSYMGANVLHEETVYPVSKINIPIHILNTNSPSDKGTEIVSSIPSIVKRKPVTGIAGRKGFSAILLQKALMNEEIGYLSRLLKIFEEERISVDHCPTGIDTISIVLKSEQLDIKKDKILNEIKGKLNPDVLNIEENISLFAVVGEGMVYHKDVIVKIFKTLSDANIGVKMIDQGSSGINVIIGVSDNDYEKTIKALSALQDID